MGLFGVKNLGIPILFCMISEPSPYITPNFTTITPNFTTGHFFIVMPAKVIIHV